MFEYCFTEQKACNRVGILFQDMSVRESSYATKGHPLTITPLSLDSLKKNGIEWVKDLGRKNVENLMTVIQWNEDNVSFFLFQIFSLAQSICRTYVSSGYPRRCFHMLLMVYTGTPSITVHRSWRKPELLPTNMGTD